MNDDALRPTEPSGARKPSITTVISSAFGTLILIAVGFVIFMGYQTGMRSSLELTIEKTVLVVQSAADQVTLPEPS